MSVIVVAIAATPDTSTNDTREDRTDMDVILDERDE
jgi:hypothetical protein